MLRAIASDGITAIEMASTGEFDLLLLDLGLPGKDGWQVLEALQQRDQQPSKVIIVTARDDLSERAKSIAYGTGDYVTKPFKFSNLLAQIQTYLQQYETTIGLTLRTFLLSALSNFLQLGESSL